MKYLISLFLILTVLSSLTLSLKIRTNTGDAVQLGYDIVIKIDCTNCKPTLADIQKIGNNKPLLYGDYIITITKDDSAAMKIIQKCKDQIDFITLSINGTVPGNYKGNLNQEIMSNSADKVQSLLVGTGLSIQGIGNNNQNINRNGNTIDVNCDIQFYIQ